ncbi:hypothetical protein P9139_00590 [Curtobacterium flaccumfaciens]|nr:hypothetical protein P9139_00590 [Curtobacterium flaccumfaciens]
MSGPARAWFECASLLAEADLVVLGDYFVGPIGLATIDGLRAAIVSGGRSSRKARAALERIRSGVESPMESRFRLTVIDAGFPEPSVNVDVVDDSGGSSDDQTSRGRTPGSPWSTTETTTVSSARSSTTSDVPTGSR